MVDCLFNIHLAGLQKWMRTSLTQACVHSWQRTIFLTAESVMQSTEFRDKKPPSLRNN